MLSYLWRFDSKQKKEQDRRQTEIKELSIKDGTLFLDGERIENLKDFKIIGSNKEPGVAELTICMDVLLKHSSERVTYETKYADKEQPKIIVIQEG